jgi:hypothetical protein
MNLITLSVVPNLVLQRGCNDRGSFYRYQAVSKQSFVLIHCFHRVAHKILNATFNKITMEVFIILSHKGQNPLTANG